MTKRYELLKVFDCYNMPSDLRDRFFDVHDWLSHDSFVFWTVKENVYDDDNDFDHLMDEWLVSSGAEGPKEEGKSGERVLIICH